MPSDGCAGRFSPFRHLGDFVELIGIGTAIGFRRFLSVAFALFARNAARTLSCQV
jgi:hypothetical protein